MIRKECALVMVCRSYVERKYVYTYTRGHYLTTNKGWACGSSYWWEIWYI